MVKRYELPDSLMRYKTELGLFHRELPRLLEEDGEGRYVVVHRDGISDPWDTFGDALQFARTKYDSETFLVQRVDSRMLIALAEALDLNGAESHAAGAE